MLSTARPRQDPPREARARLPPRCWGLGLGAVPPAAVPWALRPAGGYAPGPSDRDMGRAPRAAPSGGGGVYYLNWGIRIITFFLPPPHFPPVVLQFSGVVQWVCPAVLV